MTPPPAAPPGRPAYLPQLDGLRGGCMVFVVLAHLPRPSDWAPGSVAWKAAHVLQLGTLGLDAFFLLSGFLITRLLLAERARTGRIDLGQFYARRALRIFPIYYLAVLAVALFWPASPARTLSLLTYTYNLYLPFHPQPHPLEQSWSLAVEEQFYLLWPLLLIMLPPRWLGRATLLALPAAAVATGIGLAWLLPPALAAELSYTLLPTRMLPLALGCFLAVVEHKGEHLSRRAAALAAALGACLMLFATAGRAAGVVPAGGWFWAAIMPGISLMSFSLVATLVNPGSPAWLLVPFRWPPARFLGRISYAMYLVHLPLLFAFGLNAAALDGGPAPIRGSALVVFLSVLLATASFFLIERPLARLRHRPTPQERDREPETILPSLS